MDECGVCGGSGIADGECDCEGNVIDECGVCGGSGIADGECDCAGNVVDECGVCGGSGIADGECNCAGDVLDECGVCGGSGYSDECGTCDNDSSNDCVQDCNGDWGGTAMLDDCGICGGDNSSCNDCCGVPNGDGTSCDGLCGACNDDTSCLDCAGVVNGDSTIDECGTCDNDSSNDCVQDCNGDWGGTAVLDDCGICGGDSSSCTGCMEELATNYDSDATIPDAESCCYLVITSASITYDEFGIGTGTVVTDVTDGESGDVTIVWTDAAGVIAANTDSLAYSSYTVTVTDANDCSVIVDATQTGLIDIDPLAFGLFPNPTTGAITLQVSTEMYDVIMQVFDATGRVVFTQSNLIVQGSISLDFSSLSNGTYTIMLNNNKGVSVRRLFIQH